MDERVGGAVDAGRPLTVAGRMLEPGGQTRDFALDHFDGPSMASVSLADVAGSTVVLNVVKSVDTPVCDVQTRRWTTPFPAPRS